MKWINDLHSRISSIIWSLFRDIPGESKFVSEISLNQIV